MAPAAGTSSSSVAPLRQAFVSTTRTRASSAVPLGHGLSSATGTCASSTVHLSRGINSAMGTPAPNAAPINNGTGACALRALPRHASRSTIAAVTARRLFRQTCSSAPLPDHAVAVGLRCVTAEPQTLFPDHEVAVGLRYGKANTKTLRSFARLDPVFARDNSGSSVLSSIKEESTRLATLSPCSKRPNGKEPFRVEI